MRTRGHELSPLQICSRAIVAVDHQVHCDDSHKNAIYAAATVVPAPGPCSNTCGTSDLPVRSRSLRVMNGGAEIVRASRSCPARTVGQMARGRRGKPRALKADSC